MSGDTPHQSDETYLPNKKRKRGYLGASCYPHSAALVSPSQRSSVARASALHDNNQSNNPLICHETVPGKLNVTRTPNALYISIGFVDKSDSVPPRSFNMLVLLHILQ